MEGNYLRLMPGLSLEDRTNWYASSRWRRVIWSVLGGRLWSTCTFQQELSSDAVFVVSSQTFTIFRLRKTAEPVEISVYSFRVFVCACRFVISSIPGKSSLSFPLICDFRTSVLSFPCGLFLFLVILLYFPFPCGLSVTCF